MKYILQTDIGTCEAKKTKPVVIPGFEAFKFISHKRVNEALGGYTVTEVSTGFAVAHGMDRKDAEYEAGVKLEKVGMEKFMNAIEKAKKDRPPTREGE